MTDYDRREFLQRGGVGAAALVAAGELELAQAIAGPQASSHVGRKALRELERVIAGRVFVRGGGGYGKARKVYNTRYNHLHPAAVVQVKHVADVRAVMKWADKFGVNLRARSGGHSYAGYSSTNGGVVVDVSRMRRVKASNGKGSATIGAGVGLIRMYSKLAKQGLTVPGGSCPTVGITGLALGGGMGFASRKYGLCCDNITGVSIVTPDGQFRKVDAGNDPDLLWASQGGGGGNFGIVTSLTFKTHRVKKAAYYFIGWPWSQASQALEAWQKLTADATPDLCPFFSLATGTGAPLVRSEGQFFGSESDLRAALKPLTDVAGAKLDVGTKSYGKLMEQWAGCARETLSQCEVPHPSAFWAASDYVHKALDSKGREDMLAAIEERQAQGASGAILLDGYGGAINEVEPDATAFAHRRQIYCIQYYAGAAKKSEKDGAGKWVRSARKKMSKHVSGQAYQNYIDPNLKNWPQAYYERNLDRLKQIKTTYDPDNRLRFKQGIKPNR